MCTEPKDCVRNTHKKTTILYHIHNHVHMVCQFQIIYTKTKSHATHTNKTTILYSVQSNIDITFQICITYI